MNDLDMYKELIGREASVEIAGTQFHGKIKKVGRSDDSILCSLDVPTMGIFFVKPSDLQLKENN